MTTPRDLLIIAMDMAATHSVDRGDLSLALAGAEAIDLLDAEVIELDGERIVPGPPLPLADRLLNQAASSLTREPPYEPVGDWLWRRGRGLPGAYLDTLEADGDAVRERHRRWLLFHTSELVLVDSSARRRATYRLRSDEPVLATLAAAVGINAPGAPESPTVTRVDDVATATVLTAVDDALGELAAERQRRAQRRDDATADNVRRGY
ncbi:GOLPH3/VPS74 family protein [Streptomyces coffeae]|uniref:GPP34 family phosphoprotein n=1 Tax=Streptomyces coffeae TaxID=621382 RepID=A0ABS1NB89_9ACTN|nr:GPP34 family phosphoprotein [Streptomyces coffeae]MBL1097348.1 GPP34 family phosphoprotein [Streptomyces coffeae]